MNCGEWEERLALYAGGDLPAGQAPEVVSHLAECAGCQVFASGLKASLDLLRGSYEEIPAANFTALRARVLQQIERERRPFWRRAWALGLLGVAVALLVGVAVRPSRWLTPRPPEEAIAHPPAPLVVALPPVAEAHDPAPVAKPVRPRPRLKPDRGEPVLFRMVTDNPDVVIYWISERRGDY